MTSTTDVQPRSAAVLREVIGAELAATGLNLHAWTKREGLPYKYVDHLYHGRHPASEASVERIAGALALDRAGTDALLLRCGIMPRHIIEAACRDPGGFLYVTDGFRDVD